MKMANQITTQNLFMNIKRGLLTAELKSLRIMRQKLKVQLEEFELAVTSMDSDKLPDSSVLFKILTEINQIVDSTPMMTSLIYGASKARRVDGSVDIGPKGVELSASTSTSADPPDLNPTSISQPSLPLDTVTLHQEPSVSVPGTSSKTFEWTEDFITRSTESDPTFFAKVIWAGSLAWTEIKRDPISPHMKESIDHQLPCEVSIGPEPDVLGWFVGCSEKLSMQLIPKSIILDLGPTSFEGVKSINFHFPQGPTVDSLTTLMTSGLVGCVHFVDQKTDQAGPTAPKKIFLLLLSQQRNSFVGFIPKNQNQFRHKLKTSMNRAKLNVTIRNIKQEVDSS